MKNGTGIAELLKSQGFDWHDYDNYGRVNVTGIKNGLKVMVDSATRQNQWFHVNVIQDNTFTITLGLQNQFILDSNIPSEELATRFHAAIIANRKVKM